MVAMCVGRLYLVTSMGYISALKTCTTGTWWDSHTFLHVSQWDMEKSIDVCGWTAGERWAIFIVRSFYKSRVECKMGGSGAGPGQAGLVKWWSETANTTKIRASSIEVRIVEDVGENVARLTLDILLSPHTLCRQGRGRWWKERGPESKQRGEPEWSNLGIESQGAHLQLSEIARHSSKLAFLEKHVKEPHIVHGVDLVTEWRGGGMHCIVETTDCMILLFQLLQYGYKVDAAFLVPGKMQPVMCAPRRSSIQTPAGAIGRFTFDVGNGMNTIIAYIT